MKYLLILILTLFLVLGCSLEVKEQPTLERKCGVEKMLPMDATTPEMWYGYWKMKGMLVQWI